MMSAKMFDLAASDVGRSNCTYYSDNEILAIQSVMRDAELWMLLQDLS
jgi:hypothetical protein